MEKIAVIGIGGSGKTLFARRLAQQTGLPVFHMDTLLWKGNWEEVSEQEYLTRQRQLLDEHDSWIIEGYVDEALAARLQAADTIIYFDYSGLRCAWRVLRRWFMYRGKSRLELPEGSLERLDLGYFWRVLTRKERPGLERALLLTDNNKIMILHSPHQAENLLRRIAIRCQSCGTQSARR
jgi:adenylate kinase family enzyme